jgi:hypothetical protein
MLHCFCSAHANGLVAAQREEKQTDSAGRRMLETGARRAPQHTARSMHMESGGGGGGRVFRRWWWWCNRQPELWWKRRDKQPDKQAALSRRAGRRHGEASAAQRGQAAGTEARRSMAAAGCMAVVIVHVDHWPTRAGVSVFHEDASASGSGLCPGGDGTKQQQWQTCQMFRVPLRNPQPVIAPSRPCPSRPPSRVRRPSSTVHRLPSSVLPSATCHPPSAPTHPRTSASATASLRAHRRLAALPSAAVSPWIERACPR